MSKSPQMPVESLTVVAVRAERRRLINKKDGNDYTADDQARLDSLQARYNQLNNQAPQATLNQGHTPTVNEFDLFARPIQTPSALWDRWGHARTHVYEHSQALRVAGAEYQVAKVLESYNTVITNFINRVEKILQYTDQKRQDNNKNFNHDNLFLWARRYKEFQGAGGQRERDSEANSKRHYDLAMTGSNLPSESNWLDVVVFAEKVHRHENQRSTDPAVAEDDERAHGDFQAPKDLLDLALSVTQDPSYRHCLKQIAYGSDAQQGSETEHFRNLIIKQHHLNPLLVDLCVLPAINIAQAKLLTAQLDRTLNASVVRGLIVAAQLPIFHESWQDNLYEIEAERPFEAVIHFGPGHFHTQDYLGTPGFKKLCSMHSFAEVLARMSETKVDDVIAHLVERHPERGTLVKLRTAKAEGHEDLLSAHIYLLKQPTTEQAKEGPVVESQAQVLELLEGMNNSFKAMKKHTSDLVKQENTGIALTSIGFIIALASTAGATFLIPAFLATVGLPVLTGLLANPAALIVTLVVAAIGLTVGIVGAVKLSNGVGSSQKMPARQKIFLMKSKSGELSAEIARLRGEANNSANSDHAKRVRIAARIDTLSTRLVGIESNRHDIECQIKAPETDASSRPPI